MKVLPGSIIVIFFCTVALSACSKDAPLEFQKRYPDAVQEERFLAADRALLADFQPTELAQRVITQYEKAQQLSAIPQHQLASQIDDQSHQVRKAMLRFFEEEGRKRVRQLCLLILTRFEQSLDELIQSVPKVLGAAAALLAGSQPPAQLKSLFDRFAKVGGAFLPMARKSSLLTLGRPNTIVLDPKDRIFLCLAFKAYFASILPDAMNALSWIMSKEERVWYEIWIVERSTSASVQRKLVGIKYLSDNEPGYRSHLARGLVYARHGLVAQALRSFELGLEAHPGDQKLVLLIAQLRKRSR